MDMASSEADGMDLGSGTISLPVEEDAVPNPDLAGHVVVPPARLRSVPPPGGVPESVAPPVNGNGPARSQAAESA